MQLMGVTSRMGHSAAGQGRFEGLVVDRSGQAPAAG